MGVGRVKDIFKLDGGEYIAPERLETIYCQCKYLSNVFVYGDSNKSNVVGVEIPNTPPEICQSKEFNKVIVEDLKSIAESAKLNRYEQLPAVHVDGTYWSPDTGLVTDAMKNKRDPLYDHYKDEIAKLYKGLGQ